MAFVEDFFDILHRVHAQQQGHLEYKKTLAEVWNVFSCHYKLMVLCIFVQVSSCYDCLPHSVVQQFETLCDACGLQKPQKNQAPLKPIISSGFMTRGQVISITVMLVKEMVNGLTKW